MDGTSVSLVNAMAISFTFGLIGTKTDSFVSFAFVFTCVYAFAPIHIYMLFDLLSNSHSIMR